LARSDASAARQLADEVYAYRRATEQETALWNGELEYVERWDDVTDAAVTARLADLSSFAERARDGLADDDLTAADRSLLEAVEFMVEAERVMARWRVELAWVNPEIGLLSTMATMLPRYPLVTADHGERYLAKIANLPAFVDDWRVRLRAAALDRRTPITRLVDGVIAQLDVLAANPLSSSELGAQLPPRELDAAAAGRWRAALHRRLDTDVAAAFARLADTLRTDVRPVGSDDDHPGLCHLAGGAAHYERLVWAFTSVPLSAAEVHRLGVEQVARLEDEYRALAGPLLGTTEVDEIYRRLRDDPALHYDEAAEVVADATDTLARATAAAPRWFGRLPHAACTASAIDAGAVAYYSPPARDGSKPGAFYFNTNDPSAWARFELQSTTFHEGIPGHHLQLAIAQENDELHRLLADYFVNAHCEGWALYAERLADEMGLYSTALDRVGMLGGDSLRACRLVVDTGLHALGWSREQAITYMVEHSPMSRRQVEAEIDRYIGDPGQALGYMIGRLEIDRIRADAERQLGERFDIRTFHDVVLAIGSVPLPTLRRAVDAWVGADQG
jgi:uncharacterized protein (DUF885 family)